MEDEPEQDAFFVIVSADLEQAMRAKKRVPVFSQL